MELKLIRKYKKDTYTIGKLYIDGAPVCETLEDKDRGLGQHMTEEEIKKSKVYGKTAIPSGRYRVTFTYSPKFAKCSYAINGMIPLILNVKGYSAIRIHAGNDQDDTEGCVLLGENKAVGKVLNSKITCEKVFRMMYLAFKADAPIWIDIK